MIENTQNVMSEEQYVRSQTPLSLVFEGEGGQQLSNATAAASAFRLKL